MFTEYKSVQNPIIEYAKDIGWKYINPEDAIRMRTGITHIILREIFIKQFVKLNSSFADEEMAKYVIKRMEENSKNDISGNFEIWQYFIGEKSIFIPNEKRDININLMDFENIRRNEFSISDEFSYSNGNKTNRADIVFFINGIPLFIVETKAPDIYNFIEKGINQIDRYHKETPELIKMMQIYNVANAIEFLYGPTWNMSSKYLFSWKIDKNKINNLEKNVKSFFDFNNVLEFIKNYILFIKQDNELKKIVLRPHQIDAVNKIIERSLSDKKRGLIWHTQGSGKTYTMIVSAKKIMEDKRIKRPLVLMLVDRNELESQLFSNLKSSGFADNVEIIESKKDLKKVLSSDISKIVVSTIQKFDKMPEKINTKNEIFVFIDEAHRTTAGKLGTYLMGSLPNATIIGFTGTPISNSSNKNDTFIIFGGDDKQPYLDKYGIEESIKDKTTLPLNYAIAPTDMLVDREMLEKEFLNNAEYNGVSDIEVLNEIIEKQVNLRNMVKNQERMEKIAKFISNHFKENVEPMGYKAFLVAIDREACTIYKKLLDKYLPESYSKVIISRNNNDNQEMKKFHTKESEELEIRNNFRDHEKEPKILIVTDKLLTGFDAPILYCMYLDKPMRDHVLLQAIARINRPFEYNENSKPAGLIVDFIGIFAKLRSALAFDSKTIDSITDIVKDINLLKNDFENNILSMKSKYIDKLHGSSDKEVGQILDIFKDDDKRNTYYSEWKNLENMFDILSPDEFLRKYLYDYENLAKIYNILKQYYDEKIKTNVDLSRKTAELVRENTKSNYVNSIKTIYTIDEKTIESIKKDHQTDRERILSMIKSILNYKKENGRKQPFLISIGERAEEIAKKYKEGIKSSEETVKDSESLINEINDTNSKQKQLGIPDDAFSLYYFLEKSDIANALEISKEMSEIFIKYDKWKTNPKQEREIRNTLLQRFIQYNKDNKDIDKFSKLEKDIVDKLKGNYNAD